MLLQLNEQLKESGIREEEEFPTYITSDRGSNIQAAVKLSQGALIGVPCFSHVMHRACMASMINISTGTAINKVIRLAASFHRSVPRT